MSHPRYIPQMICFSLLALSFLSTSQLSAQSCADDAPALTPAPLEASWAVEWWMPRHESKLSEAGRETARLLFLGDSITHGWETTGKTVWDQYFDDLGGFNLGFSGDRTENVLWRIENGTLDGLSPELVILMIGTNNTGHRQDTPECTSLGIGLILEQLLGRLPNAEIMLLSIFPRAQEPDHELRQLNDEINRQIKGFGEKSRVHHLDINHIFLTDDGFLTEDIMPDMLHPNEYGYQLWAEAIFPKVKQFLDK